MAGVNPDSAYDFVSRYIDALSYAEGALATVRKISDGDAVVDSLVKVKSAREDFFCAAKQLREFTNSGEDDIKALATGTGMAYTSFGIGLDQNADLMAELDSIMNSSSLDPSQLSQRIATLEAATSADARSDQAIADKQTWNNILEVVDLVALTLVAHETRESEPRLRVSQTERIRLQERLRDRFGETVTQPHIAGQSFPVACAVTLYRYLGQLAPLSSMKAGPGTQ